MTPSSDVAGLITKLAAIMADTQRMPKDERNPQGWFYTSVMDMLDAVRPAMAKHKLAMIPDVESCDWSEGLSARGTAMTTCHMTVRWTVYDGETGASISFRTIGEAIDSSDKATNKAMTAAQKLAISKLVMMSTGDAEDTDASHGERVAKPDAPRRDAPAPYGICPDHDVAYFQTPRMRNPAHKREDGGWCDKPEVADDWAAQPPAEAPPAPGPLPDARAAAAKAATQAGFGGKMPVATAQAPHGVCEIHKTPWLKTKNGQFGHYFTPNPPREDGKGEWCPRRSPSLAEHAAEIAAARHDADEAYTDLGPGMTMKPKEPAQ